MTALVTGSEVDAASHTFDSIVARHAASSAIAEQITEHEGHLRAKREKKLLDRRSAKHSARSDVGAPAISEDSAAAAAGLPSPSRGDADSGPDKGRVVEVLRATDEAEYKGKLRHPMTEHGAAERVTWCDVLQLCAPRIAGAINALRDATRRARQDIIAALQTRPARDGATVGGGVADICIDLSGLALEAEDAERLFLAIGRGVEALASPDAHAAPPMAHIESMSALREQLAGAAAAPPAEDARDSKYCTPRLEHIYPRVVLDLVSDCVLSNNALAYVPAALLELQSLRRLDVSKNQLHTLPGERVGVSVVLRAVACRHERTNALPQPLLPTCRI